MGARIPQRTVSSCTPTATGRSIANSSTWHHRVPQGAFERLELLEGKLSRAVLRGLSGSNLARLPGIGETCRKVTRPDPTHSHDGPAGALKQKMTVSRFLPFHPPY